MKTKFICLANSKKEGGRCIAGIELDHDAKPIFIKGRPKWIRPIGKTEHGEVPIKLAKSINLLDIVEITNIKYTPNRHQTENVSFNDTSITVIGKFDVKNLPLLCDKEAPHLFGNKGKAVIETDIDSLSSSLMLLSVSNFKVHSVINQDSKPQLRLIFTYGPNEYDLAITDPIFLEKAKTKMDIISKKKEIFISVSLALPLGVWHHKLVAGIMW